MSETWFWLVVDGVLLAAFVWLFRQPISLPEEWTRPTSNLNQPTEGSHAAEDNDG